MPPWVILLAIAAAGGVGAWWYMGPQGGTVRQGYDGGYDPAKDDYSAIHVGAAVTRPSSEQAATYVQSLAGVCMQRGLDARAAANMAVAMAANIYAESAFDPLAGGDVAGGYPRSIGWYQMNSAKGAAGYGYPVSVRSDPQQSTAIMLDLASSLLQAAKGGASFMTLTQRWCQELERPKNARTKGLERLNAVSADPWLNSVLKASGVLGVAVAPVPVGTGGKSPGARSPTPKRA